MSWARLVRAGSILAGGLTAHTAFNMRLMRRPAMPVAECREYVTVCIPARNEAHNIESCVRSVLASEHLRHLAVLVLDDGSADDTAEIARRVMDECRVLARVIQGKDIQPPDGWMGKTWACERLREEARGEVLVFVDADVALEPTAIAAGVQMLRKHQLQLVSPYPRQLAVTAGERLVQPLLQWLWLTFLPLRLAEGTRPESMAAANGQFMILDASALHSIGGFASVKGDVLDDVALVRALKRLGFRGTVADGTQLATCRMYSDWNALRAGYEKNLWAATGSIRGAVGLGSMLALAYVVPPLGALHRSTRATGLLGYLAGVGGRLLSAHATGASPRDAFAHPLSIVVLLRLLGGSWIGKRRGALRWKGRRVG